MDSKKIKNLTIHALLIAIMAIMAFTPIGYIKIGTVQMTLMCIPVTAGIFFGGKKTGLLLGFVFGLTSFVQCFGMDAFGTSLFSMSPVKTALMCFVPRMLMGFLVGLFFELFKKSKVNNIFSYVVISLLPPMLNTLFFVTAFIAFFKGTEIFTSLEQTFGTTNLFAFFAAFCGLNAVLEVVLNTVVGIPMCKALEKVSKKS